MNTETEAHDGKRCCKCGEVRPLDQFWVNRALKSGLSSKCVPCSRTATKQVPRDVRRTLLAEGLKTCYGCKQVKPLEDFQRNKKDTTGRQSKCRVCCSWRKMEPTENRRHHLRIKFGITPEEYDRMFSEQGGVCAICGRHPKLSTGDQRRLSVDHNHDTGKVRGLLCYKCNVGLGSADDSVDRLVAMAAYLLEHEESRANA